MHCSVLSLWHSIADAILNDETIFFEIGWKTLCCSSLTEFHHFPLCQSPTDNICCSSIDLPSGFCEVQQQQYSSDCQMYCADWQIVWYYKSLRIGQRPFSMELQSRHCEKKHFRWFIDGRIFQWKSFSFEHTFVLFTFHWTNFCLAHIAAARNSKNRN